MNGMKHVLAFFFGFLLVSAVSTIEGCGGVDRQVASLTGYSRICIDGVMYYQFTSGATVAYKPDGHIKTC